MTDKTILKIFNLEFPSYIDELTIGDYKFKRIENYKEAFDGMMHLVNMPGGEFNTQEKTGTHQITATIEIPQKEKKSVLPWENKNLTQIDDILFLLSIFTNRNVFKNDWEDSTATTIISDHRIHQYGGELISSIDSEWVYKNANTNEVKTKIDKKYLCFPDWNKVDIGFEKGLNQVLDTISSQKWQSEYESGYFLFLFKSAIQRQITETSFILSWTIWEHIFAIKNRGWADNKTIEQMSADNKISFILSEYFLKKIDTVARKNIQRINKARNRLVHFGKKTEHVDYKEMIMFIRLTEQLMAIILKLSPSNIFNSFERLDAFLRESERKQTRKNEK